MYEAELTVSDSNIKREKNSYDDILPYKQHSKRSTSSSLLSVSEATRYTRSCVSIAVAEAIVRQYVAGIAHFARSSIPGETCSDDVYVRGPLGVLYRLGHFQEDGRAFQERLMQLPWICGCLGSFYARIIDGVFHELAKIGRGNLRYMSMHQARLPAIFALLTQSSRIQPAAS